MKIKAQIFMEYAVIIGVIIAGLIAMQTYTKRATQGRLRSYTDQLGGNFYSPRATTSIARTVSRIQENSTQQDGTSETNAKITQRNERTEALKSLADEPQRW